MTRLRGLVSLSLAAAGALAIVLLVRDAGAAVVLGTLARSVPWLVILIALEIAAAMADTLAARSLHGARGAAVSSAVWARGALAAYVSAQCLPGGRALGEILRAASLGNAVGRTEVVIGALFLHGGHVLAASFMALAAVLTMGESDPVLRGLALVAFAWTLALGSLLMLAPRSTRLAGWLIRRAKLAALEPSPGARLDMRGMTHAMGWLVTARVVHLAQAGVVVACVVGHTSLAQTFAAEAVQLVSASFADAVPGQTGVLEGAFRSFASLLAPGLALPDAARRAVTIALLLRLARVGLAVTCGAIALIMRSAGRSVIAAAAGASLALVAVAHADAQEAAVDPAPRVLVHQRLVAQLNPSGAEHLVAIGGRTSLHEGPDLLLAGTYFEAGAISYVSPVYAMTGGYMELSPLSCLVLRAEATSVGMWPIGMDGAGFYPVDDYGADLQAASLPGAAGELATGVNVMVSMVLQAAVQLGPVRPIVWTQLAIEYERLGEQAFHFSPRYGAVLAREDWMVASSSLLLLEVTLEDQVRLRVGAYDDLRAVPSSGQVSNVIGPVAMLVLSGLDASVPEVLLFLRAGAHFDETSRAGEWTGLLGLLVTYEVGDLR